MRLKIKTHSLKTTDSYKTYIRVSPSNVSIQLIPKPSVGRTFAWNR